MRSQISAGPHYRGSANVAVSLRRDEPYSVQLAAIWPVKASNAFIQCGLHRALKAKDQRLVSTERDGYFGSPSGSLSGDPFVDWNRNAFDVNASPQYKHRCRLAAFVR